MRVAGFLQLGALYANIRNNPKSINGAGGLGVFWDPSEGFRGQSSLRKFLGSKEHLDLLKIDFDATEMITVQDYNKKN